MGGRFVVLAFLLSLMPPTALGQDVGPPYHPAVVVQPDQIILKTPRGTARLSLAGIEFPAKFKDEARAELKDLVGKNPLRYEPDPKIPATGGKVAAYVFVAPGDAMLNEELVAKGLARVVSDPPCSRLDQLRKAEDRARDAKVGIWTPPPAPKPPPEYKVVEVPDRDWIPKPGDRAFIHQKDGGYVLAAKDVFAYRALMKAAGADDDAGIEELRKAKRIAPAEDRTPVLVIERHQNEILTGGVNAIELRFLAGPLKDQTAWVSEMFVERFVKRRVEVTK